MEGLMDHISKRRSCKIYVALGFFFFFFSLLFIVLSDKYLASEPVDEASMQQRLVFPKDKETITAAAGARKLMTVRDNEGSENRTGDTCSKDNVLIFQGASTRLPNGIPTYTVQIQNVCVSGSCSISDIHLSCGWFSSARLINPRVFRRLGYNDCLVNNGNPLNPGECLSFQYANTFQYPFSVSSIVCN